MQIPSLFVSLSLFPQLIFLIYIEKEYKMKFMNFSSPGDIILERFTRRWRLFFARDYDYITVDELRKCAFCVVWIPT